MVKNDLFGAIKIALKELNLPADGLEVEKTVHGDYSSNIAFKLPKNSEYQNPVETAKKIVGKIPKTDLIEKVEVVEPGFINFFLSTKEIQKMIQKILESSSQFGVNNLHTGEKARVEFVSANPTGPLHIGNARGGPLGDIIASVLEMNGYSVIREYYNNDIGTQIDIFSTSLIDLIKKNLGLKVEASTDAAYQGDYLKELADQIAQTLKLTKESDFAKEGPAIKLAAIEIVSSAIIQDLAQIGIKFDEIIKESSFQEEGKTQEVINLLKSKGLTKEKEGALWFAPADDYLKDRESVLLRSDGRPTYFADDIAYHQYKFESKPNLVVNILGSNHHGHVPRLVAAIAALGEDPSKYKVVLYQYVRVKRGSEIVKMSKRAGNFVTAREVIEEVGKDAFRFFLVFNSANTHMDFDLELAKEKSEANPVYYIQYAHARASNILKKSELKASSEHLELLNSEEELNLIKAMIYFPELVSEVGESFNVQQLAHYCVELSERFHRFYEKQVVITEDKNLTSARLALVEAVKITLANSLRLLGISAPERM